MMTWTACAPRTRVARAIGRGDARCCIDGRGALVPDGRRAERLMARARLAAEVESRPRASLVVRVIGRLIEVLGGAVSTAALVRGEVAQDGVLVREVLGGYPIGAHVEVPVARRFMVTLGSRRRGRRAWRSGDVVGDGPRGARDGLRGGDAGPCTPAGDGAGTVAGAAAGCCRMVRHA